MNNELFNLANNVLDLVGYRAHREIDAALLQCVAFTPVPLYGYWPSFLPVLGVDDGFVGVFLGDSQWHGYVVQYYLDVDEASVIGPGDAAIQAWIADKFRGEPAVLMSAPVFRGFPAYRVEETYCSAEWYASLFEGADARINSFSSMIRENGRALGEVYEKYCLECRARDGYA